ncbi:MAG TPA: alpha/beta hydrolase [Cytophagaceae bacterium]|jgi:pimeloyl-ACP methyl ester carboxylesterase|nr:alpha/beta hydrolase [Cytophagaceae bacterium]
MLEYNDSGNGFPLILIHGFCESRELWKYCEKPLASHYRVIIPDLPGFGESRLEASDISIDYHAEQIKHLLDALRIEQCIMIGHSLGGYVTLAFAEKYENRLKGFGLFHSTAFADSEERKENRNKTIAFIEKYGVATFAQSFVPPLFSLRNRERLKSEIEDLVRIAASSSEAGVIETTIAMRDRPDRTSVLKNANVPVLLVVGKKDGTIPLEKNLEQCHLAKHSIVHFIQDAGHMGMIENKEEAQKILQSFAGFCL